MARSDCFGPFHPPSLPAGTVIRAWEAEDFEEIVRLSTAEGWPTPGERPDGTLAAWRNSTPTLVAVAEGQVVGFLRALSDGEVTTYLCELLVDPAFRGRGVGRALLEACHRLVPRTRIDLLSTEGSDAFYEAYGCRPFKGFRKTYR